MRTDPHHPSRAALLAGSTVAALALGALIYLAERDAARVWLMPTGWSLASLSGLLPAGARDSGPSFVHVYAFSVLSALCLRPTRGGIALTCVTWLVIDAMFEACQHTLITPLITDWSSTGVARFALLDRAASYCTNGRFDTGDLLAAALGCSAAIATLTMTHAAERGATCSPNR